MLKNFFKIAWRNLWRNKMYSLINIVGLATSLAACILLLLWVQDEKGYDGFHKNADNIYKISARFKQESKESIWGGVPAPLATFGKKELPEVVNACRMVDYYTLSFIEYNGKKFYEAKYGVADPSLFTMFNFPLIN